MLKIILHFSDIFTLNICLWKSEYKQPIYHIFTQYSTKQLEYIFVKYPLVYVPVILRALPILDCSPMLFIHSDKWILRTSANKAIF